MKSKIEKRTEALERLKSATYKNSKAKRTGSKTKEQWEAYRLEQITKLEGNRR